jgi:hypothetical protein
MAFEVRMDVGEIKQCDALAILIGPSRLTGCRAGHQGAESDRPGARARKQRDRGRR